MTAPDHADRLDALASSTDPAVRRLRRTAMWFLACGKTHKAEVFLTCAEELTA